MPTVQSHLLLIASLFILLQSIDTNQPDIPNITYPRLEPFCHQRFEETYSAMVFQNYCTPWDLDLPRVPSHLRHDICYSKCLSTTSCWYYKFTRTVADTSCDITTHSIGDTTQSTRDTTQSAHDLTQSTHALTQSTRVTTQSTHSKCEDTYQCIVCIRDLSQMEIASVGGLVAPMETDIAEGEPIQSRTGIAQEIIDRNMLDINCTSELLGHDIAGLNRGSIDIAPDSQITYLQFCNRADGFINGFAIAIDNGPIMDHLCLANQTFDRPPIIFAPGEHVTRLRVWIGWFAVSGITLHTNRRWLGLYGGYNAINHLFFGTKLSRIEYAYSNSPAGAYIRNIRFFFDDCD